MQTKLALSCVLVFSCSENDIITLILLIMNEHLFIYLQSSRVILETMYSRPVVFAKQTPSSPHRGPDRPIGVYLVTTAG